MPYLLPPRQKATIKQTEPKRHEGLRMLKVSKTLINTMIISIAERYFSRFHKTNRRFLKQIDDVTRRIDDVIRREMLRLHISTTHT